MKRSSPLWGSVSVLIGVVIAILALVRGAWLVPLLLLTFTAWGLWVVMFQLQPAWDSIRGYRKKEHDARKQREASLYSTAQTNADAMQLLLRHVNHRISAYLRAVERYCSHAHLRRFSFSTVAYRAMQQSIVSWKRGESRRRQAEEAYCALCGRRENVCDAELSEAYFFSELQKCGTPQQAAFALLRLHGYSIAEIAARYNLDPRRVRRMLKSLYSAYLRLRGDGKEATK